jgi:hypothetical protein
MGHTGLREEDAEEGLAPEKSTNFNHSFEESHEKEDRMDEKEGEMGREMYERSSSGTGN